MSSNEVIGKHQYKLFKKFSENKAREIDETGATYRL